MFEEPLQHLLERWKKSFGKYARLKAEAEGAVARWEWTNWERYSDLPFHFERYPARGRVLKEAPSSPGFFIHYGFDQQNRVRLHRDFHAWPVTLSSLLPSTFPEQDSPEFLYSETFYQYWPGQIDRIEFSVAPHIPLSIQQVLLENSRVIFCAWFQLNGFTPL
jgi:hypothetical protein